MQEVAKICIYTSTKTPNNISYHPDNWFCTTIALVIPRPLKPGIALKLDAAFKELKSAAREETKKWHRSKERLFITRSYLVYTETTKETQYEIFGSKLMLPSVSWAPQMFTLQVRQLFESIISRRNTDFKRL